MNYKLFDVVKLKEDIPQYNLKKGERGAIIHVFTKPDVAYEVEFVNDDGKQKAELVLEPSQIEPIS